MAKTSWVIDKSKKYAVHEGTRDSCVEYVATCVEFWGHDHDNYHIATGAPDRIDIINRLKKGIPLP